MQTDATSYNIGSPTMLGVVGSCCVVVVVVVGGGRGGTVQRVLEVDMGSFTPIIFGTNGEMGEECKMFMKHLAVKLAEKDVEGYPFVISLLRTRTSFEILKSVSTSIRVKSKLYSGRLL